jgi:hypothetical protein
MASGHATFAPGYSLALPPTLPVMAIRSWQAKRTQPDRNCARPPASENVVAGRAQIGVIAGPKELGDPRAEISAATALRIPPDIGKCLFEQNILPGRL